MFRNRFFLLRFLSGHTAAIRSLSIGANAEKITEASSSSTLFFWSPLESFGFLSQNDRKKMTTIPSKLISEAKPACRKMQEQLINSKRLLRFEPQRISRRSLFISLALFIASSNGSVKVRKSCAFELDHSVDIQSESFRDGNEQE